MRRGTVARDTGSSGGNKLQPKAKTAFQAIYNAEDRATAIDAARVFADEFDDYPKAAKKITGELDTLLAFYDYPAEHWIHLRTTNPIESTFSTVRLRTRVTRGAGSRQASLAMAYKLLDATQDRWRKINAPHHTALVRAGATFDNGQLQQRNINQPNNIQEAVAA